MLNPNDVASSSILCLNVPSGSGENVLNNFKKTLFKNMKIMTITTVIDPQATKTNVQS